MSTETREYWEKRWQEGKTAWDRGAPSPALRHWLERDQIPEGRVLVPGCGNGHEVEALAEAGFQVTALDIVPGPLEALGNRLAARGLQAELLQDDVFTYAPAQPFDAVYEQTCLCAFNPEARPSYAAQLARWIRPGGTLLALFTQTPWRHGPPFHASPEQMRVLFTDDQWQWPDQADLTVPHEAGFRELGYRLVRR